MQVNEIFNIDKYSEAYEFAQTNELTIKEIDHDQFGQRQFQIVEIPAPTEEEQKQNEIAVLRKWFDVEYTKNEQKYRRLHTLGLTCDNGQKPYDALVDLYNVAETKRKRIQELGG